MSQRPLGFPRLSYQLGAIVRPSRWLPIALVALQPLLAQPVAAQADQAPDRALFDVPLTCEDRCSLHAAHMQEHCELAGGDADECMAKADRFIEHCLGGCEQDEPPPCTDRCRGAANDKLKDCVAAGGRPEQCARDARGFAADCVENHCTPPSCDDRCESHARRLFRECIARGNRPGVCRERIGGHLEECYERCEDAPPSPCAERCSGAATKFVEACVALGGDPERCAQRGRRFLRRCRFYCETIAPRCRLRCAAFADEVHKECIEENGEDSEECAAERRLAFDGCVDGCDRPPQDTPCEQHCDALARRFNNICQELGGNPEECATLARELDTRCRNRCEHGPGKPCRSRCVYRARHLFAKCIDENGTPERCRARLLHWLRECVGDCPRRPQPCKQRCTRRARRLYAVCLEGKESQIAACVEEGGDPEACEATARRQCRRRINHYLEHCIDHCRNVDDEPPTCRERCGRARETVLEECIAAGGTEDECIVEADDFRRVCRAGCATPGGPCNLDCDAASERLRANCEEHQANLAEDEEPIDCDVEVASFLEECEARKDEHCEEETLALSLAPFDFVRGDANEDGERDIGDAVAILEKLFFGAPASDCPDVLDANDDGFRDISDAMLLLGWLFLGGAPVPDPNELGQDPTEDDDLCE